MFTRLKTELHNLTRATAALDRQTATVLTLAAVLAVFQYKYGSRKFFRKEVSDWLDVDPQGLIQYIYGFTCQGITGLVIPVLVLVLIFRLKPSKIGLGLGDWKLAGTLAGLYIPVVTIGCWFFSAQQGFQDKYPRFDLVAQDWKIFLIYEALFLLYWFGWEYLWRGFVLFGTAHTFGHWAIFIQMIPFAVLHVRKPGPEAFLSIFGALLLGAVVWRCRAFWIAVPIHAYQMMSMDFFCSLRERTGVDGVGPTAFFEALKGLFNGG